MSNSIAACGGIVKQFVPNESPSPRPSPDRLTAPQGTYTFAWISDTQHYSRSFPDVFYEMTSFLYAQRQRMELRYVIHTGDLVHNFDDPEQWKLASGAMEQLGELPRGVLAGNHDVGGAENADYEAYEENFGAARFEGNGVFAMDYQNNRGHCDLVDAGDTQYLFAYMGYPVGEEEAAWLSGAFAAYPQRVGVLCVHDYFNSDLSLSDQGRLLLERVVAPNPNVYMVLCGHRYNSACVPAQIGGRLVLQLICNYQAAGDEGGSGYIRFMQFDEGAGVLRLVNYSPLLRDYVFYDDPNNAGDKYAFDPAGEEETVPLPWKEQP